MLLIFTLLWYLEFTILCNIFFNNYKENNKCWYVKGDIKLSGFSVHSKKNQVLYRLSNSSYNSLSLTVNLSSHFCVSFGLLVHGIIGRFVSTLQKIQLERWLIYFHQNVYECLRLNKNNVCESWQIINKWIFQCRLQEYNSVQQYSQ